MRFKNLYNISSYGFEERKIASIFLLFLVLLIFESCQPKHDLPITIDIIDNWQFKRVGDTIWNSAKVPGNVFSDLLENKRINDPFVGDNENKVQWVSDEDWEYKTTFLVNEETLKKKNIELSFEGLDTYASVFLNDSLILKTNNAFREFKVNPKSFLKSHNELRILFESTSKFEEKEKQKLAYELPEGDRIFTRKAQFQYGWDWGPKLNTSGIWRSIKLVSWNDFRIQDLNIKKISLDKENAALLLEINNNEVLSNEYAFEVFVNDSLYVNFKNPNPLMPNWIPLTIKHPKRWWPHDLGEPYLYDIKLVVKEDEKILDSLTTKYGIRDIELVTEKDSIGETFYFKVNDVPVYAKGANYIPQNSFQNKVTDEHYEKLLNDVVEANMNMLRVWGGGIYENDIFYDLCDKKGILVWQDFMFACAMYPGDTDFLNNVKQEAEDNIKRLRNHSSIALWCGNNENSEGWHRWGWQVDRSEAEKTEIWKNYLAVFDSILPKTVAKYTDLNYWESSPKYGRGNPKYKTEGDAHDWWIWHDAYPFEHLEENVPRFMSEFGFQSFPSFEAIRYINQNDSIEITSEQFKNHQKHIRGFQLIDQYMARDFPIPKIPEDYVYMSQLLQAYGITRGIEAQRRAKPHNMGTLFWQLNDCWPVVSWSSVDFMGNWKALHYKAKESFKSVLISNTISQNIVEVFALNDGLESKDGKLTLEVRTFDNDVVWSISKEITIEPLSKDRKYIMDLSATSFDKNKSYLVTKFNEIERIDFFVKPKDLKLNQAKIQQQLTKVKNGFNIELKSETFQKDVFLYSKINGHFETNFFHMLPNKAYSIHFETDVELLDDLKIKTFNTFVR